MTLVPRFGSKGGLTLNNPMSVAPCAGADVFDYEASFLSAIGNAKRLHILRLLAEGEISVTVLAEEVGLSQSATSQHLAVLRDQELVQTRRVSQTIYYSLQSSAVRIMLDTLTEIFGSRHRAQVA